MSFKNKHLEEDIKRQVVVLIRGLKNSSLKAKQISVVRVDLNSKGFKAKVYISSFKGVVYANQAIKFLKKASGYIKHEISKNLRLKKAPQIDFVVDDSLEYCSRLEEIFLKINRELKYEVGN